MSGAHRFGRFEVRSAERQLLIDGKPAVLGARAFDVLQALVERRDRVVSKAELFEAAWPGLVVEENNLQVQVSALRKLLGPQSIATIPGRGYRFVAAPADAAPTSSAPAPAGAPLPTADSPTSVGPRDTNLPAALGPLLGRGDDLALLDALVESHRCVTVVGAGGIGKSRLAQAAAHAGIGRWPDGVWMVELAGLNDPALLPHAIAQPLGVNVPDGDAGLIALIDALASRRMLLVIDNCEHLLDPVSAFVDRVLKAAPAVHVLATSQEPLRLEVEQQYRIEPLAVPRDALVTGAREFGALALFEACVRSVAPRYELGPQDLPLAIEICRHLDGLPLAIELAAARVPLLGLRAVHDLLRERFRLLTGGARTALRRHQTLRAALAWSHDLLNPAQRAVFRRLGVFSGGFTMELAQAVCTDEEQDRWTVLEHLAALVEKSLVVTDAGDALRYRLLESARAFALEQLAAAGETAALLRRHATAMLAFLRRADDGNMDSTLNTGEYAALVLPELDNLRSGYAWAADDNGDRAIAIGLAAHAGPLIDFSMEFSEWLLAQRPHLQGHVVDEVTAARFWRAMAAANMQGVLSFAELLDAAERATDSYRALRRPRRLFSALRLLAIWRRSQGDFAGAQAALDEAAALIEPGWPAEFRIVVLRFRAWDSRRAGRLEAAMAMYREAIRLAREAGDWRLEVIERANVSDLRWEMGQNAEAVRELDELLEELSRRPASDFELVETMSTRMWILSESGRVDDAARAARAALPVMRRMPRFRLEGCAHMLWRLGRPPAAARVLGALAAEQRAGRAWGLGNEQRMVRAVQAGLESLLTPVDLAEQMALGESLRHVEVCDLLAEAVAAVPEEGSPPAAA